MEDVNKPWRISFSLSKLEGGPQEINFREIRLHFQQIGKNGNYFKSDVFAAVAVVDAKAPYLNRPRNHKQIILAARS